MAHILTQNPIRYAIDKLKSEAHALIVSKQGNFINCTEAGKINGFNISYTQPANTKIAFAFSTGDKLESSQIESSGDVHSGDDSTSGAWFRLNTKGYAVLIDSQNISYEALIDEGNTISELLALTNIPAFKGYKVRVAIALYSADPRNALPSVSMSVKAVNDTQVTQKIEYSPIYELGRESQILNVTAKTEANNNGAVLIEGCINDSDTWQTLPSLAGMSAESLQLRATLNAPQINSSIAKVTEANIIYTEGTGVVNGDGSSEIITETHNWYKPVRHCRLIVKHAKLEESAMMCYVSFRPQFSEVKGESLGTGDGKAHTYQLKYKNRVKFDSVKLYYDGIQVFGGYEVNGETGRITCAADTGQIITCGYEHSWELEKWQELALTSRISKPDYDESEYYLRNSESGYICAVKIAFAMKTGSISNEIIGKGMGREYSYKLAHRVKDGNITVTQNNAALSKANYYVLDDTQYIRAAATNGYTLRASYDWISEIPRVYNFHAVFSE